MLEICIMNEVFITRQDVENVTKGIKKIFNEFCYVFSTA